MYPPNQAHFWLRNWKRGSSCEDRENFVCKICTQDDGFGFSESVKWVFLRQAITSLFDSGESPSTNMQNWELLLFCLSSPFCVVSLHFILWADVLVGDFASSLTVFFLLLMWSLLGLHVCMCTVCMPGAHGGHKRALNPLAPEVNHLVDAGNQTWVLWKSSQCS